MADKNSSLPSVSAIITTHNRLNLLKRAVDSVLTQTYPNIELIVVDDGSDDGTEEWGRQQSFNYIRIPKGESRGGNYARNLGAKAAKGEYLAFLDDDDYWSPEKTSKQIESLKENQDSIVYTLRRFEGPGAKESFRDTYTSDLEGDISKESFYRGGFTSTSTLMMSKKALSSIDFWDENLRLWQDNDLIIRLSQKYPFKCVPEELTAYWVDNADKAKISNKYNLWKDTVKYLKDKHQGILKTLSFSDKRKVLYFLSVEGSKRAKLAHKPLTSLSYKLAAGILCPDKFIKMILSRLS